MGRRRRAVVAGGLVGRRRLSVTTKSSWPNWSRWCLTFHHCQLQCITIGFTIQWTILFFYPLKDFDSLFTFWLFLIYYIDLSRSGFLTTAKISLNLLNLLSLLLSLLIVNGVWQVYLNLNWLFEKLWAKVLISTWFQLFLEWQKWFQFCPLWMAVIFLVVCWHTLRVGSCCSSAHGSAEPI